MQGTWDNHAAQSDADHPDNSTRRLLDLLGQALRWSDEEFRRRYPELIAQIERDCRQQEEWLEAMPSAHSMQHLEEHARMLSVMHHTASCVMQGDIAMGRTATFLLADWVRVHAETMDKPLSDAILQKRLGLRPRSRAADDLIDIR